MLFCLVTPYFCPFAEPMCSFCTVQRLQLNCNMKKCSLFLLNLTLSYYAVKLLFYAQNIMFCSMWNQTLAQHIMPPYIIAEAREVFILHWATKQSTTSISACTVCQVSKIKFSIRCSILAEQSKQLGWNMALITVFQHLISVHVHSCNKANPANK